MELFALVTVLILVVLVLEMSKHVMFKAFAKTLLVFFILVFIILTIIGTLSSENMLKTDNTMFNTGAAVIDEIKENPMVEKVVDKIKDFIDNIKK